MRRAGRGDPLHQTSGVTIVWIEHIVHALLAVVSRLVVLNFGRKIWKASRAR